MKPGCQITHTQILKGSCPWCGSLLGGGGEERRVTERDWDYRAMSAALDDPNIEVRSMTLANLTHEGPSLSVAIPLLSKALIDSSAEIRVNAEHSLARLGRNITARDISQFEQ